MDTAATEIGRNKLFLLGNDEHAGCFVVAAKRADGEHLLGLSAKRSECDL
jgi:hypothetical protein